MERIDIMGKINNKALKVVAETLSDNGYNPDWQNNDATGDWYLGAYGYWNGIKEIRCEAIVIPSHDGFGEMVMDCFINDCDKGKEIDYQDNYGERVIFVKAQYNNLTEEYKEFLCEGGA